MRHSHTHSRARHFPTSCCELDGDALLVTPTSGPAFAIPLADIAVIAFRVGSSSLDWHDFATIQSAGRTCTLTSALADPGGIRESRRAYRKFVRKLIKQTSAASPNVRFLAGYPPSPIGLRHVLYVGGGLSGLMALGLSTEQGAQPFLCVGVSAALLLAGFMLPSTAPPPTLDPVRDLELMVPPRDAE